MMAMAAGLILFSLILRRVHGRACGLWPCWWVFSLSLCALQSPTARAQMKWQVERHTTLSAVFSHFVAGPFLRETGPGRDVDYASAWATYKF